MRPQDRRAVYFETEIDLGGFRAPLKLRIDRRARRLIVRVDSLRGLVWVTAPSKRAAPEALRFARERAEWIRRRFDEGVAARPFRAGGVCPYRGIEHLIVNEGPARATVRRDAEPPRLTVGGAPEHLNRRLTDWLKREARAALLPRVAHYAERLGRRSGAIAIRETRSRWGSCSADGRLSFSWRLILAPPWILDYVAAHECAHLVRLDHSPEYWRVLRSLDVDEEAARCWFEREGARLHSWGVESRPES